MNSVCTISQLQLEQKLRAKLNLYNKIMLQNFLIFYYIDNFFFFTTMLREIYNIQSMTNDVTSFFTFLTKKW